MVFVIFNQNWLCVYGRKVVTLPRTLLALFPLLLSTAGLPASAQAPVTVTDHILQFHATSPQFKPRSLTPPARQVSFKSSVFVFGDTEDLNDYRSPDAAHPRFGSKLHGQRGLGRVFLLTTCGDPCTNKDFNAQRSVWINKSIDPALDDWQQAIVVDRFGLTLLPVMFDQPRLDEASRLEKIQLEFAINGSLVHGSGAEMRVGNSGISHYYIQVFEKKESSCRQYGRSFGEGAASEDDDGDYVSIDIPLARKFPQTANGIVVGAPKVYDSVALMALRNAALTQMQAINPFVASAITGNYGTLQGVTKDVSYLNLQGQYAPPAPATVSSINDQTVTCPAGYYPYGASACAPIASGTTSAPLTATATSVTATPSAPLAPTIPAAPSYTAPATPGVVGQSSADSLVEQVQLSAQLQVYQLLLQGAQSDTLFLQNSRAVANRAQTTIGFPISIDPPRQFRHAVAEVRILIEPFPSPTSSETPAVSIVNLLPSQKTYNVAKITSKQRSFGGAAVIEQVASVGVSGGKSKDRLYLAKDTDTVALQYDHPSVRPLRSPLPDQALTGLEAAMRMQRLDECDNAWFALDDADGRAELDDKNSRDNSVLFGWQFRPVLGADYVAGGPRQVFAQLALPEALGDRKFLPAVLVQTRWREYDEKRQVVGPVFHSSCTVTPIYDPVILEDPLRVHDATWDDVGSGVLKIRAHGSFFSPAITMQNGNKSYAPVITDGHEIQFYAPAKDLLLNGEIKLLSNTGSSTSLTIPSTDRQGCRLDSTSMWAIPQADGTARVTMIVNSGKKFEEQKIQPRPLVLIGTDVYGLKEKPFQNPSFCDSKDVCLYHFTAPADSLRSASSYYVRDISWSNASLSNTIRFTPFMAKLSKYSQDPPKLAPVSADAKVLSRNVTRQKTAPPKPVSPAVTYMIAGTDLKYLTDQDVFDMKVYSMGAAEGIVPTKLSVLSDTQALLTLPCTPTGKTITIAWSPSHWPLNKEAPIAWDLALPGKEPAATIAPSPTFLYAGDSRTVTYTGADFSNVQSVGFEGATSLPFKVSSDNPQSMDVVVTTAVTKEAGHKELIATARDSKGKLSKVVLPIEIFKR